MKKTMILVAMAAVIFSCGAQKSASSATADVQGEDFWAGLPTVTIQRGLSDSNDVCSSNSSISQNGVIGYDEWARERAQYTNICFQVWRSGVTDRAGANFSTMLDVRAIYRVKATQSEKTEYVNSDRQAGNNRRYVFDIRHLDPLAYDYSGTRNEETLELVFAITDKTSGKEYVLKQDNGMPFEIRYSRD